jgi:hypothetical protein
MYTQIISAILLLLSGFLITGAEAFFSVKGFLMFIPDPELTLGLLVLAIAFVVAKITASTFLFHKMRDSGFPLPLKVVLSSALLVLITLSGIFTFSHLNVSVSKSMATVNMIDGAKQRMTDERTRIVSSLATVDRQMESIPENTSVNNRLRMKRAYDAERQSHQTKLDALDAEISKADISATAEDKFLFLNSIAKLFDMDKDRIFTLIVVCIVALLDPLAITLILAGTFILSQVKTTPKVTPTEPYEEPVVPETPKIMPFASLDPHLEPEPEILHEVPFLSLREAEFEPEVITAEIQAEVTQEDDAVPVPDHTEIAAPEVAVESLADAELREELEEDVGKKVCTASSPLARKILVVRSHINKKETPNDPK